MSTITGLFVGVGVFVFRNQNHKPHNLNDIEDRKFVVGTRLGSHGAGTLALPGGHLEPGESFSTCAAREVLEETGLMLDPSTISFLTTTNSILSGEMVHGGSPRHYVTIFMAGQIAGGESEVLELREPEKCAGWRWMCWRGMEDLYVGGRAGREGVGRGMDERGGGIGLFQPLCNLIEESEGIGGFDPCGLMIEILEKKKRAEAAEGAK